MADSPHAEAAADIVADMLGIEVDEAPAEEADEQPEAVAAPEAQEATEDSPEVESVVEEAEEVEIINLDPQLPEELAEYLAELDFENDDEPEEPVAEVEEQEEDEYEDEQVTKLRKELAKERKRREHAEGLRLQAQRSNWEKEAKKYFPLSEHLLGSVNATSRRAFLREAQKAHETVKPFVSRYIEEAKKQALVERQKAKDQGRQEAEKAWGKPLAGPGSVPLDASAKQAALEKARSKGSLKGVIKEMFNQGAQV